MLKHIFCLHQGQRDQTHLIMYRWENGLKSTHTCGYRQLNACTSFSTIQVNQNSTQGLLKTDHFLDLAQLRTEMVIPTKNIEGLLKN